jgi:CBS domain containing-hemolysin-like protein
MDPGASWLLGGAALATWFLLSGMEAGLFALNPLRLRRLAREGSRAAEGLLALLRDPEAVLWTTLVGSTLSFGVLVALAGGGLLDRLALAPGAFATAALGLLAALYLFADLLPKLLFRWAPNRTCLLALRPFQALRLVLLPGVWAARGLAALLIRWTGGTAFTGRLFGNRAEFRELMRDSMTALTAEERAMIERVLDLQARTLRQVMTPMGAAVTAPADLPWRELRRLFQAHGVGQVPVWQSPARGRRILGVVALRDVLFGPPPADERPAAELIRDVLRLAQDTRLEEALRLLRGRGERFAVVTDEQRREVGIVTLRDLLKAVFGEVTL